MRAADKRVTAPILVLLACLLLSACSPASTASTGDALLPTTDPVIAITAQRFVFNPVMVSLKKGEPVVLELSTLDRVHGFNAPDFNVRTSINPGAPTRVRIVPAQIGTFTFHCDVFCGDGHDGMSGQIVVHE